MLKLAADLSFPPDVVTEALAWIGARGSGKTHGAGKLVELMLGAGIPVVVLDPVGTWYGLRLGKNGKGPGLSVPVFGGLHGDVPLEPTAGALVADLLCDRNLSAVLDYSQFDTDAQKTRFVADFAERIFLRKKKAPSVLHLVFDEAQEVIPQNPQPGEAMMLHRMQRLAKIGRNFGLGVSFLTQRPQDTSKKVLNQCQTVLAFRLTGPQERKAMKDWIAAHDLDQGLVEKLPGLPTGTCHVWSPAFLKVNREVHILPKDTYDASATPKFGQRRAAHTLAPIDLAALRDAMQASVEKAAAEDPQALRAQVAALELRLHRAEHVKAATATVTKVQRVGVPVFKEGHMKRLEAAVKDLRKTAESVHAADINLQLLIDEATRMEVAQSAAFNGSKFVPGPPVRRDFTIKADLSMPRSRAEMRSTTPGAENIAIKDIGNLSPAHRRILNALAFLEGIGVREALRGQVGLMSKMNLAGGYGSRVVGELKTGGLIDYPSVGRLQLTPAGHASASAATAPQTSEELHDVVCGMVSPTHQKALRALISAYPGSLTRADLGARINVAVEGGYGQRVVGELKTLGAVEYPDRGKLRAAEILFLK